MKFISSCRKQTQTSTPGSVTPTGTKSPKEVDGTKEAPVADATAVAEEIAETTQSLDISLKGK